MVIFRVDGNKEIGTGHIMRCLSMAKALRSLGEEVVFVLADSKMQQIIIECGFEVKVLDSDYRLLHDEVDSFIFYIKECQGRGARLLVVVDSYFVTETYFKQLGETVSVVYVDDLQNVPGCVEYIINYNVYADEQTYKGAFKKALLLGCEYAPLRDEFTMEEYVLRDTCKNILLTTGGADLYNISTKVLKEMLQGEQGDLFADMQIHVVVGMFHQHKDQLEEIAREHANVILHHNVGKMSELMQNCDLAITAAGSTIYELSCIGVPSISFSFVDNQDKIVEGFASHEAIKSAGYYLEDPEGMIKRVVALAIELIGAYEERARLSRTAHALVDGKGALRIASAMQSWYSN
ncbi:MAG: UDP-2,4-diacetamido-2,4,6-trideoxy-beta-L-altropyranose hydrolase [Lachnospiraceae bacterium]